jgi:transposase InsO family protein
VDPESAAFYSSANVLYEVARKRGLKVSRRDVDTFLKEIPANSLFKQKRTRFKRAAIVAHGLDAVWFADLMQFKKKLRFFNGYRVAALVLVDGLSGYIWAEPLSSKSAKNVSAALQKVIDESGGRSPITLITDGGREFYSKEFYREHGIWHVISSRFPNKSAPAEAAIGLLRRKLAKYRIENKNTVRFLFLLPQITAGLNNRYLKSIGMRPKDVSIENSPEVFQKKYAHILKKKGHPRFKVGDSVRLRVFKSGSFAKSSETPSYSKEIYTVDRVLFVPPIFMFTLRENKERASRPIEGRWYGAELASTAAADD